MTTDAVRTIGSSFWALLVGIDSYLAANPLRGCVNDVAAMRIWLTNQLGVPPDHIRVLTNEQATRAAILTEFQTFLIENPAIRPGDEILFHYSGHGSQMRDTSGLEPDGLMETIVPHDSRTAGVFDIPDKTIAVLLDRLATAKGDNITVILDSCHSGSGTRRLDAPGVASVRLAAADDRLPPAGLDADVLRQAAPRSAGPSGWSSAGIPYVLLAGCRDQEVSNEYAAPSQGGETVWHGALTYFTLATLRTLDRETTYGELYEQAAARVNAVYPGQTPQCEGNRNRICFGGAQIERDPFISVRAVSGNSLTLDAGVVHGLQPGSEVALYPAQVRTRADLPPAPLATAEVVSVTATSSLARLKPGEAALVGEHALITKHVYAGLRQKVALQEGRRVQDAQAIGELRQAILHATPDGQPSPYVQIVDPGEPADLWVEASSGQLLICGAGGELLVQPEDLTEQEPGNARAVLHALEAIARYRSIADLTNQGRSQLAGKVKLRLRRYTSGPAGPQAEDLPAHAVDAGGELTIDFDPDHDENNLYVVDVINESPLPVYPAIFILSPDYSISRLYPNIGQQEAIRPGGALAIGLGAMQAQLQFYLPDGWDACRDHLKAILTTEPANLDVLIQEGLNVPLPARTPSRDVSSALEQLLDAVVYGGGSRFAAAHQPAAGEDWTTVELPTTLVRMSNTTTLTPPPGRVLLGDGITLLKPEGFAGSVSVATWGQASRGAGGAPGLRPPPGLAAFPDSFTSLGRAGVRTIGPADLVITIEADEAARRSITTSNPLRFEIAEPAAEQAADWLPVVFDGEDYLLAGYGAGPHTVDVVALPQPAGVTAQRDISRAIQLFIYKKMGRQTEMTGLHSAGLDNDQVVYNDVSRDQFRRGQTVALFVHGFTSDTRWMVRGPAQFLCHEALAYDHLLTWDYETFGTGVEENGALLAEALQQKCGFGANDGLTLHVYAHSMGCLVSRCMIELSGGHRFVDRLVMAGPPNRGAALASEGKGLVYLINALLNFASDIPPIGSLSGALQTVYEQGAGAADIMTDSPIVRRLNGLTQPANVPYLVLAGENLVDASHGNRLDRLARKVLDTSLDALLGEQNDGALGLSSMRDMRGGSYPKLTVQVVPCDHFHYFVDQQAQTTLRAWLGT